MSDSFEELRKAEEDAKAAWDNAVETVKEANEAVTVAHKKWLIAYNAMTNARAEAAEEKADEKQPKK
jgi:hypothetical protein